MRFLAGIFVGLWLDKLDAFFAGRDPCDRVA